MGAVTPNSVSLAWLSSRLSLYAFPYMEPRHRRRHVAVLATRVPFMSSHCTRSPFSQSMTARHVSQGHGSLQMAGVAGSRASRVPAGPSRGCRASGFSSFLRLEATFSSLRDMLYLSCLNLADISEAQLLWRERWSYGLGGATGLLPKSSENGTHLECAVVYCCSYNADKTKTTGCAYIPGVIGGIFASFIPKNDHWTFVTSTVNPRQIFVRQSHDSLLKLLKNWVRICWAMAR